jgi:hypothetical protein
MKNRDGEIGNKDVHPKTERIKESLHRSQELGKKYEEVNREKRAIKDRASGTWNRKK